MKFKSVKDIFQTIKDSGGKVPQEVRHLLTKKQLELLEIKFQKNISWYKTAKEMGVTTSTPYKAKKQIEMRLQIWLLMGGK
jgi:hypothetical protein